MVIAEKYSWLFESQVLPLKSLKKTGFRYSYFILFGEYQTRLCQWKKTLGYNNLDLFNKDKSFHNLIQDISPSWLDQIVSEKQVVDKMKNSNFQNVFLTYRHYYGFFISMYLNWELFKDRPEIQRFRTLPHPYETVYLMFCRGADIFNSERMFDICNRSYIRHDGTFKSPSLDSDFLDFVDAEMERRKAFRNLPDQGLINQLWLDFTK